MSGRSGGAGPTTTGVGCCYPRLREFLPAGTILEIAPGLWALDALPRPPLRPPDRRRSGGHSAWRPAASALPTSPHASFHKNDGMSLDVVPDGRGGLRVQLRLARSLRERRRRVIRASARRASSSADGVAFIHHSNLAAYRGPRDRGAAVSARADGAASRVSAELFEQLCREAGLLCIGQELLQWREKDPWFRDCFSMLTRPGSRFARENRVQRESRLLGAGRRDWRGLPTSTGPPDFRSWRARPPVWTHRRCSGAPV